MEKGAIKYIQKILVRFFSGLDLQLGLILLGLVTIGFITFLSASQNTPVRIGDELRNLALSFAVMWIVSRIPPKMVRDSCCLDLWDWYSAINCSCSLWFN